MKSKDKASRIALRISLILMVILSVVLSAYIWGSDSRFSRIEQTSNQTANKENVQKSLRDIYVPTQMFIYDGSQLYQVYDGTNNLPLEFNKATEKLTRSLVHPVSQHESKYRQMLRNHKYMQLTYPDQITLPLFLTSMRKTDNREFNRFFVPTDGSDYLYLGNDINSHLYRISLKGKDISFKRLYQHAQTAQTKMPVSLEKFKDGYSVIYEKAPEMSSYSYLTFEESDSYFVYRLLGSGSATQRNNGETVTYSNDVYQRLIAAKKTHNYEFIDYQENSVPKTMTNRLTNSLYYVRKIGLSEPDLRFFDADDKLLIYQNFVEEYPVFLPGQYNSRAQVKFASNGMTINFNSLDLQIPVPTDDAKKTLEPTNDVIEKLQAAGYKKKEISRIVIGYTVTKDKSSKDNLVDLVPTYYVKINHQWQSIDEWLKKNNSIENSGSIKEGLVDGL